MRPPVRQTYRNEAAIRGLRSDGGSGAHLWHMAPFIRCQSAAPPPVAEYDAWLAANPVGKRGHSQITGAKLRRAVILRRNGETMQDAARLIGMTAGSALARWIDKLPPELAA